MFNFGRWLDVFSDLQRRGCLQEKTRTGASFILGWLFDFVSRFHYVGLFHTSRIFEDTFYVDKIPVRFKIANITHALPVPVHRQTYFTPKRVVVSFLSEILAPVQQLRWTHTWVTRAGMIFCGSIMLTNIEPWEGTGVNMRRRESRFGVM